MERLSRIMRTKRENINVNHSIAYGINESMLFINASAPLALQRPFKRFGLSDSCKRMLHNVGKQCADALHYFLVAYLLPIIAVAKSFFKQYYFHSSSSLMGVTSPRAICSSPSRRIFIISGDARIISVVLCSFSCLTMSLIASMVLRISFSSPAMRDNWRKSS